MAQKPNRRLDLQDKLQEVIGIRSDGKQNVYFQPPESIKLNYPCIIYQRSRGVTEHANNMPYRYSQSYDVTLITKDPDSGLVEKLAMALPGIEHSRFATINNLNHDYFALYY